MGKLYAFGFVIANVGHEESVFHTVTHSFQ